MTDQQNDGDAKAIDAVVVLENYSVSPDGHPVKVKASYLAEIGYVPAAELEAVRLELGKWIQLANRIHQAAHTTAGNDGLPARVEELFQATEELRTQLTTERARRLPWKELARQNGVAFRAAHKQLADTERQLALSRAGYRGAEEAIRKANEGATTERARTEEAERQAKHHGDMWLACSGRAERLTTELAAANARADGWMQTAQRERQSLLEANARAGRLEEAATQAYESLRDGSPGDAAVTLSTALSATPQASTEQGEPRCTCSYSGDAHGKHEGHARTCPMRPIATSPIPQVAQASGEAWVPKMAGSFMPAQPKPPELRAIAEQLAWRDRQLSAALAKVAELEAECADRKEMTALVQQRVTTLEQENARLRRVYESDREIVAMLHSDAKLQQTEIARLRWEVEELTRPATDAEVASWVLAAPEIATVIPNPMRSCSNCDACLFPDQYTCHRCAMGNPVGEESNDG